MEMLGKSPKQGDPRKGLAGVRVGGSQDRLWGLLAWAQEDPSWQRTDSGSMEKANAALRQMDPDQEPTHSSDPVPSSCDPRSSLALPGAGQMGASVLGAPAPSSRLLRTDAEPENSEGARLSLGLDTDGSGLHPPRWDFGKVGASEPLCPHL